MLCTKTMHKVAETIEQAITVPFFHLADATAGAVAAAGVSRVALLGTRYTMEQDFYRGRLEERDLEVLVPDEPDRTLIHDVAFSELVRGVLSAESKSGYPEVIERLLSHGARV